MERTPQPANASEFEDLLEGLTISDEQAARWARQAQSRPEAEPDNTHNPTKYIEP